MHTFLKELKSLVHETAKWFADRPEDWSIPPKKSVMNEWAKHFGVKPEEASGYWLHIACCISSNPKGLQV